MLSLPRPFDESSRRTLGAISSADSQKEFVDGYLRLIRSYEDQSGVVYVWNAAKELPRLRGQSKVLYIGMTTVSLSSRYPRRYIQQDTKTYWTRLTHILETFGPMSVDVYPSDNPRKSENDFMFSYFQSHLEMPPLNNQAFKLSMLDQKETQAFYGITS